MDGAAGGSGESVGRSRLLPSCAKANQLGESILSWFCRSKGTLDPSACSDNFFLVDLGSGKEVDTVKFNF
jgi:hypothetical protein